MLHHTYLTKTFSFFFFLPQLVCKSNLRTQHQIVSELVRWMLVSKYDNIHSLFFTAHNIMAPDTKYIKFKLQCQQKFSLRKWANKWVKPWYIVPAGFRDVNTPTMDNRKPPLVISEHRHSWQEMLHSVLSQSITLERSPLRQPMLKEQGQEEYWGPMTLSLI
jgi:hypothetical protein